MRPLIKIISKVDRLWRENKLNNCECRENTQAGIVDPRV